MKRPFALAALAVLISQAIAATPVHAAPLFPLWLMGQMGCAAKKGFGECPDIDFFPEGTRKTTPGNYSDSKISKIIGACNPAVIGVDWLNDPAASLPESCEDALLEGLPLAQELAEPATAEEQLVREGFAKALQALLFVPMRDPGGFFGDSDPLVYCPSLYEAYFGAPILGNDPEILLTEDGYLSGSAPVGRHLVQFILERTDAFSFKPNEDEEDETIASERNGEITFRSSYGEITNPIVLASTLVHESRHNAEGFQDGASHIVCDFSDYRTDSKSCDPTNFGAYGTATAYIDAAIRGAIRTRTPDGKPLLSMDALEGAYARACDRYTNRIRDRSEPLAEHFGSYGCAPRRKELIESLSILYGLEESKILVRSFKDGLSSILPEIDRDLLFYP